MADDDKVEVITVKDKQVHFQAPAIQNNVEGWGPCELPDQFKDIPYQPFSKGDRLGKVRNFVIYILRQFHEKQQVGRILK